MMTGNERHHRVIAQRQGDQSFVLPPEPIRYLGSLRVRNAIRRKERAEDHGRRPRHLDVRLAKFAAAAGKADKG